MTDQADEATRLQAIEDNVIAVMKSRADVFSLWHEVKEAYDRYRASGDDPEKAAWCALWDWDL